nr:hypothetical protein [Mycolicibacterium komanii]
MANAAGLFWDAVTEGTAHRGQVELSKAVLSAKQRPMLGGQAFGWDRKAPGFSVLIAASLALWGVDCERPARPRRSGAGRQAIVSDRERLRQEGFPSMRVRAFFGTFDVVRQQFSRVLAHGVLRADHVNVCNASGVGGALVGGVRRSKTGQPN